MFIEAVQNNGKKYLRLVQSIRVTNKSGYKVSQKKVILNIGPLDRFDDGQPNYVERLKKSFKAGTPLIPSLSPYCDVKKAEETYRFTINEGSPDCFGHPKLFSHILMERILEELGLNTFFSSYKGFTKLQYDVYGFARLLIFGRLLNPAHRSPEIIYYDVTNFYFEIGEPDEDTFDEDGNLIEKGQRKIGVSKEERKLPIVQMGLFMDDAGIPIAIETFPGNTLDHLTLRPALKKNINGLDFSRFIMVADRGICNYQNLLHVLDAGNGYIVSKSLLKSTKEEQEWTYRDEDYISVSDDFKYKSRIVKRNVKDENGNKRTVEEQVVVYWSRKFQLRAERENKKFLEFLQKLQEHPESFRITAVQSKALRKFFKKECVNEKTGEILDSSKIRGFVDFDKVAEYRKSLGYYQIVTSELTMDAQEVIDKYHGLTQIEDQFRIMKGDLNTRPLYVRTPEHVTAHLLICMISLILLRIIQKKLKDSGVIQPDPDTYWSGGMSAARIQTALNKWKVDTLPSDLYRFMDVDDPDLKRILDAFRIRIPAKLYRRAELKHIKTEIEVFM